MAPDADAANQALKGAYDTAYYEALLDVAKGAVDRSRAAAELVQKAAAAIGTLYTGLLGVTFSVSNHRLPAQGFIPALFLGLAIVMSTAYVAYVEEPGETPLDRMHTSPPVRLQRHINNFFRVIARFTNRRVYLLRVGVVALGLGVVLLPAPFLTFNTGSPTNAADQYPWPSPASVANDRAASLESVVFKARVDEVSALRQEARLQQSEPNFWAWVLITLAGLALAFGIPRAGSILAVRVESAGVDPGYDSGPDG